MVLIAFDILFQYHLFFHLHIYLRQYIYRLHHINPSSLSTLLMIVLLLTLLIPSLLGVHLGSVSYKKRKPSSLVRFLFLETPLVNENYFYIYTLVRQDRLTTKLSMAEK